MPKTTPDGICHILVTHLEFPNLDLACGRSCINCCGVIGDGEPVSGCETKRQIDNLRIINIMSPESVDRIETMLATVINNQATFAEKQTTVESKLDDISNTISAIETRVRVTEVELENQKETTRREITLVEEKIKPMKLLVYGFAGIVLTAVFIGMVGQIIRPESNQSNQSNNTKAMK